MTTSIVHNECCIKGMGYFQDNHFDLAFPDPPYGIKESSKKRNNFKVKQKNGNTLTVSDNNYIQKDWDNEPPSDIFFSELKRVSKQQAIFGANYFKQIVKEPFKSPRRNEFNEFIEKNPTNWIIWDKLNGSNDFNDCELIWTSIPIDSFVLHYMWNGMFQGIYAGTDLQKALIQQGNKKKNVKRFHPTQKPIPVYNYIFQMLTTQFQSVLDTNVGSGSSRISADLLKLNYTGFEIDKQYYQLQEQRYKQYKRELKLF